MNILIHDDCFDYLSKIESQSVYMFLVDEPYGTTKNKWDSVIDQFKIWKEKLRIIKPHGAIVHFSTEPYTSLLITSHLTGYKHKWIWNKKQSGNFAVAKYQPLSIFEEILVFT